MPNMDKTGPKGMGPKTGKGLGLCGLGLSMGRRGYGCRRGLGRYFGWEQKLTAEERKEALVDYRQALEEELEDVKKLEAEA